MYVKCYLGVVGRHIECLRRRRAFNSPWDIRKRLVLTDVRQKKNYFQTGNMILVGPYSEERLTFNTFRIQFTRDFTWANKCSPF